MAEGFLLTGVEVAALMGVDQSTISRWRLRGLPSKEVARGLFLYSESAVLRWAKAQGYERARSEAEAI